MDTAYLVIIVFLLLIACYDIFVGVGNDAVNFLTSAIGAKVARFSTILAVAALGVFMGAATSNGMMDVARHGIMTPEFFSFYDVLVVFLAVMVTDVVLLDLFNTLGMPTSTTVSLVFELLGGAFAMALLKIIKGDVGPDGVELTFGQLLNTEKAMSVILGIFLSVGIAFVLGILIQWISRLVFSFTYRNGKTSTSQNGLVGGTLGQSLKLGVFSGISTISIVWFLLINGLKGTTLMTPELKAFINENTWTILVGGAVVFSAIMTLLAMCKVKVLKFIVLFGTFALAMAFAGNDLVNFVGVPLTGLDAYLDYSANGNGQATSYLMGSLMDSAKTPTYFLVAAGVIMVLALVTSKKAQNVVKTSVDLSRQSEGDEMFGSSPLARMIVRNTSITVNAIAKYTPKSVSKWVNSRFNNEDAILENGAAFDYIRAAVNLVVSGILVAIGTSMKLPLSTTYVTFMVAMGTSLADRAWSRESAVFRITGVVSVIGGWFITAAVAFTVCFVLSNLLFFGKFVAMILAVALAVFMLIHSNRMYKERQKKSSNNSTFSQLVASKDKNECWGLLKQYVNEHNVNQLTFTDEILQNMVDSFFNGEYRRLKRAHSMIAEQRNDFKRCRRREIIGMRRINTVLAMEKNTWFFVNSNALSQMNYCLKRISEPCIEHIGNNFTPVPAEFADPFKTIVGEIGRLMARSIEMFQTGNFELSEPLRQDSRKIYAALADYRDTVLTSIQDEGSNIESMTILLNIVQESQQLLSSLRHALRGATKFNA